MTALWVGKPALLPIAQACQLPPKELRPDLVAILGRIVVGPAVIRAVLSLLADGDRKTARAAVVALGKFASNSPLWKPSLCGCGRAGHRRQIGGRLSKRWAKSVGPRRFVLLIRRRQSRVPCWRWRLRRPSSGLCAQACATSRSQRPSGFWHRWRCHKSSHFRCGAQAGLFRFWFLSLRRLGLCPIRWSISRRWGAKSGDGWLVLSRFPGCGSYGRLSMWAFSLPFASAGFR